MKMTLRKNPDPDLDYYYYVQFQIYKEFYLLWDKDFWGMVLTTCSVFRIEADGKYAGHVILEDKDRGTKYIVDFSILPEHQGKGLGKAVVAELKKMAGKLSAVTRKETLGFFLKSGFALNKKIEDYYYPGVDGYYITFENDPQAKSR